MGRASDVLAAGSADNRAVPKTPASWLRSRINPKLTRRCPAPQPLNLNRITSPPIELHDLHPPTPADCGQRPSADGVLLRRNRTIRPPQSVRDFLSGASTQAMATAKRIVNGLGGGIGIQLGDIGDGTSLGGIDLDTCRTKAGTVEFWAD